MGKKVITLIAVLCLLLCTSGLYAETSQNSLLVQGLEAYRRGDWTSALFFLRKAGTQPENINAETWYVLVMSEMYAGDYESVLSDGNSFISRFPRSSYVPQIEYQMARAHFIREEYSQSVESFTAFCNSYPDHELIPSALFWMAESLYQTFHFDEAAPVFERIVKEFPDSPKVTEAAFRIELLNQRAREEKLLYLLRVTGEEYLAAREDYERQIKESQTDELVNLKKAVSSLQSQIDELQSQLETELSRNRMLTSRIEFLVQQNSQLQQVAEDAITARQRLDAGAAVEAVSAVKATPDADDGTSGVSEEELYLLKQKEMLLRILMGEDPEGESE